jgi:putative glycosyltransferase (TIGR04348 family)
VIVICPAAPGSRAGNRTTALRWAAKLRALGNRVRIREEYRGEPCDVLIALHAHKSAESVFHSFDICPGRPVVVALTGTDLYRDLPGSIVAQRALDIARRIVILQPLALERIPEANRQKARVIYQSAVPTTHRDPPGPEHFDIAVPGHLRDEKDPFRAAAAARLLPATSRVRILQMGRALTAEYEARAEREQIENRRYCWLGELSRRKSRRIVASSRAVALTSLMEGGANVISEAIADDVPVIASRIEGSVGLLGADYPGLFDAGDTQSLANLIFRQELDDSFRTELKEACLRLKPLFEPERELQSWKELMDGMG